MISEAEIRLPYSDHAGFANTFLPCYSLEEVIAEKIRAVGGQRRFAISRDLYDIHNLVSAGVDLKAIRRILPEKFTVRGLCLSGITSKNIEQRRSEFERDWNQRLHYLVTNQSSDFETAWQCVLQLVDEVLS